MQIGALVLIDQVQSFGKFARAIPGECTCYELHRLKMQCRKRIQVPRLALFFFLQGRVDNWGLDNDSSRRVWSAQVDNEPLAIMRRHYQTQIRSIFRQEWPTKAI